MNTPNTQAHSPLPWKIGRGNRIESAVPGRIIADMTHRSEFPGMLEADANLIVTAVNAHARLIAENARLREALGAALAHIEKHDKGSPQWSYKLVTDAARTALAQP